MNETQINERSTKRQRELLSFVDAFIQGHGYGPSYREIMRALGYKSVSTVAVHIEGLITKGYLRKRDNSARSLEVVTTRLTKSEHHVVTQSQEKWITSAVNERFEKYDQSGDPMVLDELFVLVGALKILGVNAAYESFRGRLQAIRSRKI